MNRIKVENRYIGEGEPCFIVAEISCNHLQKKKYALKLIEEAKSADVDAVKFQMYTPDTMTINVKNEHFGIPGTIWEGKTLYDLYCEAYTPWDWFPELKDKAKQEGLIFFSSPFDITAVDFLEKLNVPLYKIASFEINDIPLLKKVASTKKPVIFSTGLATEEDIKLALSTIRGQGNDQIIIMKCTSAYPAPPDQSNLRTMVDIGKRFGVIIGLSDHTMGSTVPIAAVSLGARVIEKHFILDRKMGGPDATFSMEPAEFKQMVKDIRIAEQSLGEVTYGLTEKAQSHRFLMRSIFVVKDIKKGEKFTKENIRVIRPGYGMHPKNYEKLLGKSSAKDLKRGTPLHEDMVE